MTIKLSDDIQQAVEQEAERSGKTPDELVDELLRRILHCKVVHPRQTMSVAELMEQLRSIGSPIGANLTDEQLSREHMYD
jgi:predicted transcriptional regulator